MQQNTVPIMGVTGYADTYTVEKDGLIYVAEESSDGYAEFPDWCHPNAIEIISDRYGETRLEVVEHCEHCESDSPELKRVMDAWDAVLNEDYELGDPIDYDERLEKILATATHVVIDTGHYLGYKAVPGGSVWPSAGQYLVFGNEGSTPENIMPYACEIVAQLNGYLWDVGSILAEDVEDITELRVLDCADNCRGFVWENADNHGMSTPTEEELTNAL